MGISFLYTVSLYTQPEATGFEKISKNVANKPQSGTFFLAQVQGEHVVIIEAVSGNILSPANTDDIIIGMNTELKDVRGIGNPFVWRIPSKNRPIPLGTVLSFHRERGQQLHLIVCHELGKGGWTDSEKYIRFGMDYLWDRDRNRRFSMVQVGTGRIGRRDGAEFEKISAAITNSFLPVTLYVYNPPEEVAAEVRAVPPITLSAFRSWGMETGEELIAA